MTGIIEEGGSEPSEADSGIEAFDTDLGRIVSIRLDNDSSAPLSIVSRIGPGKARHFEILNDCGSKSRRATANSPWRRSLLRRTSDPGSEAHHEREI